MSSLAKVSASFTDFNTFNTKKDYTEHNKVKGSSPIGCLWKEKETCTVCV